MSKDIIYIDVEDDITAIIGKIKSSKEKIIALVPPKRVGVLQSAVNLRLLVRTAGTSHKTLVLITNNQALIALAASAHIPVAKNLQSKPELPEIAAISVDDEDDIIDGANLPVGELERTADIVSDDNKDVVSAIKDMDIDEKPVVAQPGASIKLSNKPKSGIKVPNFNSFRKKLFIGIGAGVLLIVFLVWANVFAPAAKVIITARTTPTAVNVPVTLAGNAATDVSKGLVQSKSQQLKKDISVEFDATGSKNLGEKATGTVNFSNNSLTSKTVAAATQLKTAAGLTFVTKNEVTVAGASFPCGNITCPTQGSASVAVTALEGGVDYNGATGSLTGSPSGITASLAGATSGGTDKIATVVTQEDVQKASQKLVELSSDEAKKELIKLFTNNEVVIDDSFTIDRAAATSVPAIGAEATAKAKLTSTTTYTITAIAPADLELFIRADLDKQIAGKDNQKVYSTGIDSVKLSGYTKTDTTQTARIIATGQIGPNIDEAKIKEQVKGMIYGDVQSSLQAIDGINDVDVQFSYFWVRTVPNDVSKITIEFKLQDE